MNADWPWILQIEDTLVRKWLCMAWVAKRLGAGFEGIYVMHLAKVTEKCLADRLLAPMQQDFRGASTAQMKGWWLDELDDYCGPRRRTPGLGWWEESLGKLKGCFAVEHSLISAMRSHIGAQPWSDAWESALQKNLIALIHELAQLRGPIAHTGEVEPQSIKRIRAIIQDHGRPGLLFRALGFVGRGGGGRLRKV